MTITIYIEYFFVVNYLMNYIVIYFSGILLKTGVIKVRTGAFISALIYCIIVATLGMDLYSVILAGLIGPVVVAGAIIPPFHMKKLLTKLIVLYTVTLIVGIIMGGITSHTYLGYLIVSFIKENSGVIALVIWLFYGFILFKLLIKAAKTMVSRVMNNLKLCEVFLVYEGNVIKTRGLIDSGNNLYYGEKKHPVSVVELSTIKSILDKSPRGLFTVNYKSLGQDEGIMYGIIFDKMEIVIADSKMCIDNPYIGIYKGKFSENGEYSMIIHKDYIKLF